MIWEYVAKFFAGGLLVCLFALISEACQPKQFAGLFSAAPSVLLATLIITLFIKGAAIARLDVEGAIAGAVGLTFYSLTASKIIKRTGTLAGSLLSLLAWLAVSFGVFGLLKLLAGW
jgi:hypothetical protein